MHSVTYHVQTKGIRGLSGEAGVPRSLSGVELNKSRLAVLKSTGKVMKFYVFRLGIYLYDIGLL